MKVQHAHGIGSRYDPNTPNAIDRARHASPGMGIQKDGKRWCCKCQKDKPILGSVRRNNMFVCGECK